ncbi:MAG TPA: hypothetical protein VHU15_02660 [Stellaceae bacterium]|jgi:hypothetical protein|nr:hypothetical protein [Stellaceae bacterium]
MKRVLYGAVIGVIAAVAPALAFAQSFPAVDRGQASASAHGPSYIEAPVQPNEFYAAPQAWSADQSHAPAVDWGQASASAHAPGSGR